MMVTYTRPTAPDQKVDPADRGEILDLITYYALFFDSEDLPGVLGLFTEDAYIEFAFDFGKANIGRLHGVAELEPFWAENFKAATGTGTLVRRHNQPNTVLTRMDDDKVVGTTMAMIGWLATPESSGWYRPGPGSPTYITGTYEDEFTKIDGIWYFSRRVGTFDMPLPGFAT